MLIGQKFFKSRTDLTGEFLTNKHQASCRCVWLAGSSALLFFLHVFLSFWCSFWAHNIFFKFYAQNSDGAFTPAASTGVQAANDSLWKHVWNFRLLHPERLWSLAATQVFQFDKPFDAKSRRRGTETRDSDPIVSCMWRPFQITELTVVDHEGGMNNGVFRLAGLRLVYAGFIPISPESRA